MVVIADLIRNPRPRIHGCRVKPGMTVVISNF